MRHKFGALLLGLVMLLSLLAGCGGAKPSTAPATSAPAQQSTATPAPAPAKAPAKAPKSTAYPLTIKDDAGRTVTIPAEPKRIISVAPANTELLFALGKGGSLVGRSDFCDYPAEVKSIESIGGFFPPNYEKIVSLKPDLLLLVGGSVDDRDRLANEYKLNVYVVQPETFETLYDGVARLGQVVNAQPQAEKLIADMKKAVKEVSDKTEKVTTKPKVFYEVWNDPLMTAGSSTFIDDLIRLSGGTNVGAAVKGWSNFSLEQLAAANPDVIFIGGVDGPKKLKERQAWQGFAAVKQDRVYAVEDANILSRPGPRLVLGLKWMAAKLHPDLFK